MLEVGYLIYRGHYFYPVLVLCLFTLSIVLFSRALRQNRKKMMALVNECRLTPLVLGGWVRATSSHRILPGDVVVLQPGKALFDMVLLQGNCLVVESMLSGEVGPRPKVVPPCCPHLSILRSAAHILHSCLLDRHLHFVLHELTCFAATLHNGTLDVQLLMHGHYLIGEVEACSPMPLPDSCG